DAVIIVPDSSASCRFFFHDNLTRLDFISLSSFALCAISMAFIPDPDRVKTIELIFKLRMERRSLNAIAKYLNDHAVKNFSG
ncbi:recombinase family protein, partial [Escherichia coli]|uniref:recombinase family protein n=1 Tax=Escherichia coli TaxID=562 RepID=UPI003EDEF830